MPLLTIVCVMPLLTIVCVMPLLTIVCVMPLLTIVCHASVDNSVCLSQWNMAFYENCVPCVVFNDSSVCVVSLVAMMIAKMSMKILFVSCL